MIMKQDLTGKFCNQEFTFFSVDTMYSSVQGILVNGWYVEAEVDALVIAEGFIII